MRVPNVPEENELQVSIRDRGNRLRQQDTVGIGKTEMNQAYFRGKMLTRDWLTPWIPNWEKALATKKGLPAKVLEIGSFEGRSAVFFLEYLPLSQIVCVDTFKGGDEHTDPGSPHFVDMTDVERRFDCNVSIYGQRTEKIKGASIDILPMLRAQGRIFDIVYVDGDHRASSVFFDASVAWEMLAPDGIMILDDYLWETDRSSTENPKAGIDAFLKAIDGRFDEIVRGYQIIIRKKKSHLTLGGRRLDELSAGGVRAPLVSFVLINWNYGQYVGQAIESIKRQDYPEFECLVIDNASTDDSVAVIERQTHGDNRFRVARMERNMGQLGAAIWALGRIEGGFVTFVDADDILFSNYASTHLQVHMALPRSVAFTSSAVIETDAQARPLTSSYAHINLRDGRYQRGLRPASHVLRFPGISNAQFSLLSDLCATVPKDVGGWPWGPGTSNMFRRSLLELAKLGNGAADYMRSADGHLNRVCHALAGSALIDIPLSGYRVHSSNYFSQREALNGVRNGTSEYASKSLTDSYESIELFLEHAERFGWILGDRYWSVMDQCASGIMSDINRYYRSDAGVAVFSKHAGVLRAAQGNSRFTAEILRRFGDTSGVPILRKGFDGRLPADVRWKLVRRRLRRLFRVPRALRGRGGKR